MTGEGNALRKRAEVGAVTASRQYWLALALVGVVVCIPVASVRYAPLVDWPSHLARAYILYNYNDTPAFQQTYRLNLAPLPNLAVDVLIPLLLHWFGLLTAGVLCQLMLMMLFLAGCYHLGRAIHGRPTWLALPCAYFVYCSELFWGFINYMFGLALFLFCVGTWLKWQPKWNTWRVLAMMPLVCLAYFAHLSSYAFTAVAVGMMTLWFFFKGKTTLLNAALGLLPLLPPLVVFVLYMRTGGSTGLVRWESPLKKLVGGLTLILTYDRRVDVLMLAGLLAVVLAAVWRMTSIRVVAPVFTAGATLFLFYLVMPYELFTGAAADTRFVPPAILLLLLSLKIEMEERSARAILLAWLALSTVRVGSITGSWRQMDQKAAAAVKVLNAISERARVYPATCMDCESKMERGLHYTDLYAIVFRHALVPTLHAFKEQQPLVFRQPLRCLEPGIPGWTTLLSQYDFVWSYVIRPQDQQQLPRFATPVLQENGFTLWRVRKPADSSLGQP